METINTKITQTQPFNRFSTLATIGGGFEVIDENGRAVAERADRASANGVAYMLNQAAADGSLAAVMGRLR